MDFQGLLPKKTIGAIIFSESGVSCKFEGGIMCEIMRSGRLAVIALLGLALPAFAAQLDGYAELSGNVSGSEPGVLPVVYAYNTDKSVGYTVYVVDGKYRAVNLIPGSYDVTIRAAVGQLEGFTPETVSLEVAADEKLTADFALKNVGPVPNYVNGLPYEACTANRPKPDDVPCEPYEIQSYDEIFPAGRGREIMESTCLGCHHVQLFAFNTPRTYGGGRGKKNKAVWEFTVDRMHKRVPAQLGGIRLGQASMMDEALIPPEDRDILIEYLNDNFGYDAPSRLVELNNEPELDLKALEKAQFVEYRYKEPADEHPVWPWPHRVDFDNDGNVWLSYVGCCVVRFDPRTGDSTPFTGHGGGYGIAVDHSDGTVWFSPANRLDPETGLVDNWIGAGGGSLAFDSKANLWMAGFFGGITKWDRKTNSIMRWDVPVVRSRPYGMIVDFTDKVWFADYHTSGLTRFDPETEEFKHFNITPEKPTGIRRLGVDSTNMIWTATYGSPNRQRGERNTGGSVFRLNPETGEVMQRDLGIDYSNPYNAEADPDDNIWINPDNYLVKYNQKADTMTRYPLPTRTDMVKTRITRDGAVWTVYRNAGHYAGYGGTAAVLYPDKDKIITLAAYHPENGAGHHASKYKGPLAPKVKGANKVGYGARNAEEYEEWALANGLPGPEAKPPPSREDADDVGEAF
jgi:streptogramin lyase